MCSYGDIPTMWELYYCTKKNVSHVAQLLCLYLYLPFHRDEQQDNL